MRFLGLMCCMVAEYAVKYNLNMKDGLDSDCVFSFAGDLYLEDLFLRALHAVMIHSDKELAGRS